MSKRFKRYHRGRAHIRQNRAAYDEAARFYRKRRDQLPVGGYVVFYHGKGCGWMMALEIEARPNGWLADCVAVPPDVEDTIFVAVGGNYQDGAERWEPLAEWPGDTFQPEAAAVAGAGK